MSASGDKARIATTQVSILERELERVTEIKENVSNEYEILLKKYSAANDSEKLGFIPQMKKLFVLLEEAERDYQNTNAQLVKAKGEKEYRETTRKQDAKARTLNSRFELAKTKVEAAKTEIERLKAKREVSISKFERNTYAAISNFNRAFFTARNSIYEIIANARAKTELINFKKGLTDMKFQVIEQEMIAKAKTPDEKYAAQVLASNEKAKKTVENSKQMEKAMVKISKDIDDKINEEKNFINQETQKYNEAMAEYENTKNAEEHEYAKSLQSLQNADEIAEPVRKMKLEVAKQQQEEAELQLAKANFNLASAMAESASYTFRIAGQK